MAARTHARADGARYPMDGNAALKAERSEELIRHAQELRRRRLMEQQSQPLSLRTREGNVAAVKRRRTASQWALPAALCALAVCMLLFVMLRHLEVARGAIGINALNARLTELNTDTERIVLEIAKAAEMERVKTRAGAMGFSYPEEERIIRVTLPEAAPSAAQAAEAQGGDDTLLGALLGLLGGR